MQRILQLIWTEQNIDHIARHGVSPEEVEEVCFSPSSLIRRGRSQEGLYYVLGRSSGGRFLFVVTRHTGQGRALVVTARPMTATEKRLYYKGT